MAFSLCHIPNVLNYLLVAAFSPGMRNNKGKTWLPVFVFLFGANSKRVCMGVFVHACACVCKCMGAHMHIYIVD